MTTPQIPIVTGGASGIGLEAIRALSEAGATVAVPARNVRRARRATLGMAGVEIEQLDLVDPGSIDFFAARFLARGRPLPTRDRAERLWTLSESLPA